MAAPATLRILALLFPHFVAQAPAFFRRQAVAMRGVLALRALLFAFALFLAPLLAHLFAQFAPFLRRQIAPAPVRMRAGSQGSEQNQDRKGKGTVRHEAAF